MNGEEKLAYERRVCGEIGRQISAYVAGELRHGKWYLHIWKQFVYVEPHTAKWFSVDTEPPEAIDFPKHEYVDISIDVEVHYDHMYLHQKDTATQIRKLLDNKFFEWTDRKRRGLSS